jgi:hypothetical protein
MRNPTIPAALCVALLASAQLAHAQDGDATRAASARAVFNEGVAASDAEDWDRAADRFRAALELRASSVIALNLAVALGHQGNVVEATELLRGVLLDRSANDVVRASAQETLAMLEPRVAWLEVQMEGAADDVSLQIDAMQIAEVLRASAIPLDPGAHHVSVLRDGVECVGDDVTLAEGERRALVLNVPAVPVPVPVDDVLELPIEGPSSEPAEDGGPDPVVLGLAIGGGVLVLGTIVGIVVALALPGATPFAGNAGVLEIGR